MKTIALLVSLLFTSQAFAVTQATKQSRYRYALTLAGMAPSRAEQVLTGLSNVYYYDTATELLAASPTEGVIGYANDTNLFYFRSGATWVGDFVLGTITGENGGTIDNGTNNVWTITENSEDVLITFGSNTATFSSSTGAVLILTPATTVTGDLTLNGGAGGLTFGAASSSIVVPDASATALVVGSTGQLNLLTLDTTDDQEQVLITGTTATIGLHVDVGESLFDEGTQITIPVMAYDRIRFCGNGPNATTATFLQAVMEDDYGTDMTYGGAGCDAKDDTTEGTADEPWHPVYTYSVVGMHCVSDCGTDDTMTLQLRSAAADVTGMTCEITLAGAAAECTVFDRSPVQIASGATIAMETVNSTDDDCSAGDLECLVFITYP